VIFRNGPIRIRHFSHKPNAFCTQETIYHKTAKMLVEKVIGDWKSGNGEVPVFQRICPGCRQIILQPMPEKVDEVLLEQRLSDGLIADVALFARGELAAVIEVRMAHSVEEEKAARLSVPFVELHAMDVISNPLKWMPLVDRLKAFACPMCKKNRRKFMDKTTRLAERTAVSIPEDYYRYTFGRCWKCRKEMLFFIWPEQELRPARKPKGNPIPRTVKLRESRTTGRRYWANVCPSCDSLQGPHFLFAQPEGAFFCFDCGPDTPAAFEKDLVRLAALSYDPDCLSRPSPYLPQERGNANREFE